MIQLPFDIELMNGKGVPKKFHIRRATPDDLDAVMNLQQTIVDALPNKDVYATYNREESLDALETDYCYIATTEDGDVAGYSVLIAGTTPVVEKNYGHYFDYDEEHLSRTASLDLTMVAPPYRGHGLQRLFNKIRIGQAIELGATEGLTSIAPSNPYSYNNFLIMNFHIADRRKLYGGKDRYLLRKEFFKEPEKKPDLL
ncbi:MAG: hypothetical protein IJ109_05885 [Firmicutes bacterium]|nr:hypothetical protein [Bacillota bacterium]